MYDDKFDDFDDVSVEEVYDDDYRDFLDSTADHFADDADSLDDLDPDPGFEEGFNFYSPADDEYDF